VACIRREAIAAARLEHPNIVRMLEFQADAGVPFIVMERLEGESLDACLTRTTTIPVDRAIAIVSQMLAALGASHRAGIVHRDIKPSNIFLTQAYGLGEVAKLIDFGIAKLMDATTLTQMGAVLGTPLYAAPEMLWGEATDHRADIYSIGVTLYHCITGRPPISADTLPQLLAAVREKTPLEMHQLVQGVHPQLAAVIMACLAKDPAHRPQSAEALLEALAPFRLHAPLSVVPSMRPSPQGQRQGQGISNASVAYAATAHSTNPGPYQSSQAGQSRPGALSMGAVRGLPQAHHSLGSGSPSNVSTQGSAGGKTRLLPFVLAGLGMVSLLGIGLGVGGWLYQRDSSAPVSQVASASSAIAIASAQATLPAPLPRATEATLRPAIVTPRNPATARATSVLPEPAVLPSRPTAVPSASGSAKPVPEVDAGKVRKIGASYSIVTRGPQYPDNTKLEQALRSRDGAIRACGTLTCFSGSRKDDSRYFDVEVDASGNVTSMSDPGGDPCTALNQCIRRSVLVGKFPTPGDASFFRVNIIYTLD
jgi:eukaryotic-like serine/threonine-protein kinase